MRKKSTTPTKKPSGGAALMAAGKRPVTFGLLPDQLDQIDRAMELSGIMSRSQFFIYHGLTAARQIILENSHK